MIPSITGRATLGRARRDHADRADTAGGRTAAAWRRRTGCSTSSGTSLPQTRDLGAVKLSLDYLSTRHGRRTEHRIPLDARLHSRTGSTRGSRAREPAARADARGRAARSVRRRLRVGREPEAPTRGRTAKGSCSRHRRRRPRPRRSCAAASWPTTSSGAFDIALDSKRTRRALDVLQGLTRDQPLAALYGYRIERGLRDALLGKLHLAAAARLPVAPGGRGADRRADRGDRRARRRRRRGAAGRRGKPRRPTSSRSSTLR